MMPFFDYQCPECSAIFEKMVKRHDEVVDECKACGAKVACIKQISCATVAQYNHTPKATGAFKERLNEIKKNAGPQSTIDV